MSSCVCHLLDVGFSVARAGGPDSKAFKRDLHEEMGQELKWWWQLTTKSKAAALPRSILDFNLVPRS
jgi:hypothetical protein